MNVHSEIAARPLMSERRVSLIGALMVAVGPVSMALFTPAMPEIVHAFGTTESAVKLTLSLYFAGFAFAQLVCGPLSDGFGRRPVTMAFMAIFLAASVAALLAPNIHVLIAARFLQGVGAAVGVSVSRALVRDLFTQDSSARILNLMGIMLAIGPAVSPTLGGVIMELFGWHAVFILMVAMGVAVMLVTTFAMKETISRDVSRIRPAALVKSYRSLLTSRYFMLSSLVVGGTSGAIYAQATVLPFVLINRVGLTPTQFGVGMLMQTLSFLAGSLVARRLMVRIGAFALVPIGLVFVAVGATATGISLRTIEPSYLSVMGPIGIFAFGIAFAMPAMMTAAMAPFPSNAGAASAMMGFLQMGTGLVGGLVCAALGDPVVGLATVVPCLGALAIVSWLLWRRLPAPAGAGVALAA